MKIIEEIFKRIDLTIHGRSFALNQIDLKLKPYLSFKNGFFIEAGANDGINQSNTLFFEKYRNWQGILIEPIPHLAEQCRKHRPKCIVENIALIPFDFHESHVEMQYCNLMSLVKGSMGSEEADMNHIVKGCQVQQIEPYSIRVQAKTLNSILEKHNIQKIDFLSLDVEGYELNVLKGIDFDRYQPNWMLIEARFRKEIDSGLLAFWCRM